MRFSCLLAFSVLGLANAPVTLDPAAPRIFYSDLESGPNTGGENNAGTIVTIFGKGFGASRGSSFVTIGEGRASNYLVWTENRVAFQLGPTATTGNIVAHIDGKDSSAVPFTVRSGHITFVSAKAGDHAVLKARNSAKPGDVIYLMDGVRNTADDGEGWRTSLLLRNGGKPGLPIAFVAYPDAKVIFGATKDPDMAIRTHETNDGNFVFAGLTLLGGTAVALYGSNNWRFVNNDMTCPLGDGPTACFETSFTSYVKFLGNHVHEAGKANASALYHGVYFSTDSNHIEMGWNTIENVHGCRGIQFHSSPMRGGGPKDPTGHNQYDLSVHDNVIHDTQCDGIIFATVDPSQGKVEAFNNVIYAAGQGPANPENSGNWSCIYVAGYTNTGPAGGGTVEIYNNTLAQCGTFSKPPYQDSRAGVMNGEHNPNLTVRMRNNIVYQPQSIPYVLGKGISGSHNLFYGSGAPNSAAFTQSLHQNPMFINADQKNFHLASNSPARHGGAEVELLLDKDGLARGAAAGFDLGAFQYSEPPPGK